MRPLLAGLLGALVAGALLSWATRSGRTGAREGTVAYSSGMRGISLFTLAIGLFIGYAALFASPDQRVIAWSLAAVLLGGAVWFVLEAFLVRACVTETHLEIVTPWRGTRRIPWGAITGCRYEHGSQVWVLETEGHGTVRLSGYLDGLEAILGRFGIDGPPELR